MIVMRFVRETGSKRACVELNCTFIWNLHTDLEPTPANHFASWGPLKGRKSKGNRHIVSYIDDDAPYRRQKLVTLLGRPGVTLQYAPDVVHNPYDLYPSLDYDVLWPLGLWSSMSEEMDDCTPSA